MKKLLILPIIFVLVSCQPSELDRCIMANTEPTPINDFKGRYDEWVLQVDFELAKPEGEAFKPYYGTYIDTYFFNLNKLENVVMDCYWDGHFNTFDTMEKWDGMLDAEKYPLLLNLMSSCMYSTKDEVKELQLEIEAENKEEAESICNRQGIY